LKVLADIMQDTVRDNDLLAHYDERELVMGIRIQHLEDAEIVATKLLKSLSDSSLSSNRLIRAGVFYRYCFLSRALIIRVASPGRFISLRTRYITYQDIA